MVNILRAVLALLMLAAPVRACDAPVLDFAVTLERPAPYRVAMAPGGGRFLLAAMVPVLPFRADDGECIRGAALRPLNNGWTELALDLGAGFELRSAVLRGRSVFVRLERRGPVVSQSQTTGQASVSLPLIVIDPGHGGIDAGAVREGLKESDLTLAYARALSEALIRTGQFRVRLSRETDDYLSLADRVSFARAEGAVAMLSLHADALEEGRARGAAVFTLSPDASDAAAAELVALHDRADLLVGQDLDDAGDTLAGVLIGMARADTAPRSSALAEALVGALAEVPGALREGALRSANFGVLKAPEVPSVLVELGFMSDETDLANLGDPEWRAAVVAALAAGFASWANEDALAAGLRRR